MVAHGISSRSILVHLVSVVAGNIAVCIDRYIHQIESGGDCLHISTEY